MHRFKTKLLQTVRGSGYLLRPEAQASAAGHAAREIEIQ